MQASVLYIPAQPNLNLAVCYKQIPKILQIYRIYKIWAMEFYWSKQFLGDTLGFWTNIAKEAKRFCLIV